MHSGFFALCIYILMCTSCTTGQMPASEVPTQVEFGASHPVLVATSAIDIWESEHGAISAQCALFANSVVFYSYSEETLNHICSNTNISACMAHYDNIHGGVVALKADVRGQSYDIRVHETLHIIVCCEGLCEQDGTSHSDIVWKHVPKDQLPEESPWKNRKN